MSDESGWLHTILQLAKYPISNYTIIEFALAVPTYDNKGDVVLIDNLTIHPKYKI